MTLAYWQRVDGTLIQEFRVVSRSATCSHRDLDGLIICGGERRLLRHLPQPDLTGWEVIAVQAKTGRLNLPLLGQALFSRDLLARWHPRQVRTVALCGLDDGVLGPLARAEGIEVEVPPGHERRPADVDSYNAALLEAYWRQVGGTLLDRYSLVEASATTDHQRAHGVIVTGDMRRVPRGAARHLSLRGAEVTIVHTAPGLGMYVLGRAYFTRHIALTAHAPAVRSVVVCQRDDSVLRPLAEARGIEIVRLTSDDGVK